MATTFADEVYSSLMNMEHEWTYEEVTELIDLLDRKQEELANSDVVNSYEVDEWDYWIIEKENCEALIP